jgi:hypothetical protein
LLERKEIAMADAMRHVLFQDIKPYDVVDSLDELHGPSAGVVILPRAVYWGPDPKADLDTDDGIAKAYQAVLREGVVADLSALLSREVLVRSWNDLALPDRVRGLWESRFPELTA